MALRFILVFTLVSFLFTLLSWGQAQPQSFWARPEGLSAGLALHLLKHTIMGGIVALPTRRLDYILAGAVSAVLIDVDHLGWLGAPTVSRFSHSLGFLVLIVVTMALLARRGVLGERVPAFSTGVVAGAVVCAHVTLDIVDTHALFPLWAPLSYQMIKLDEPWAAVIFGLALLAVGAATVWETRRCSSRGYVSSTRLKSQHQ